MFRRERIFSSRSSSRQGFARKSSAPLSKTARRSSSKKALAVKTTITVSLPRGSALILRVASNPSTNGICTSIRIRLGLHSSQLRMAASPSCAVRTEKPIEDSSFISQSRFSNWSSTTSILGASSPLHMPITWPGGPILPVVTPTSPRSIGISNRNSEPASGLLITVMSPPISRANLRLIAKPKPLPSWV